MKSITNLVEAHGGLHDASLLNLLWNAEDARLQIEVDDLHANSCGLPEYQGPTKVKFVFSEVTRFNIEVDLTESGLMLYDWTFARKGTPDYVSEITFSPEGKMIVECGRVECVRSQTDQITSNPDS